MKYHVPNDPRVDILYRVNAYACYEHAAWLYQAGLYVHTWGYFYMSKEPVMEEIRKCIVCEFDGYGWESLIKIYGPFDNDEEAQTWIDRHTLLLNTQIEYLVDPEGLVK